MADPLEAAEVMVDEALAAEAFPPADQSLVPMAGPASSSSEASPPPPVGSYDEFLAVMTFASNGALGCDCGDDECGAPSAAAPFGAVPPTIRDAVEGHRKRKREAAFEGGYNVGQRRALVKREDGFSVWRLDMPMAGAYGGGDPIVEYRNNHRIVFVERLNGESSQVLSIGRGIVGSAAEEGERRRVDWEAGSSYLLPCARGVACGWVHRPGESRRSSASDDAEGGNGGDGNDRKDRHAGAPTTGGPTTEDVVIFSLKVSPDTLKAMEEANLDEDVSPWVKEAHGLFQKCLARTQRLTGGDGVGVSDEGIAANEETSKEEREDVGTGGVSLTEKEAMTMRLVLELAK